MIKNPTPHDLFVARRIKAEFEKGTSPADALKLVQSMWDAQNSADHADSEADADAKSEGSETSSNSNRGC